jgi:hypothetical protein
MCEHLHTDTESPTVSPDRGDKEFSKDIKDTGLIHKKQLFVYCSNEKPKIGIKKTIVYHSTKNNKIFRNEFNQEIVRLVD